MHFRWKQFSGLAELWDTIFIPETQLFQQNEKEPVKGVKITNARFFLWNQTP
jgi:hypothetical protein